MSLTKYDGNIHPDEWEGGETSKYISNFRKLCYNAEIDVEEQKKYLYQSLPNNYFLTEFSKKKEKIKSTNELMKEFEEIVIDESNLIRYDSIIALKHVATGKYLSSIGKYYYSTGSGSQMVFASNLVLDRNGLWIIKINDTGFNNQELASYTDNTPIYLQHKNSSCYLTNCGRETKSPSTGNTEVCCNNYSAKWNFKNSKLENYQGYLRSNDIINLSTKYGGEPLQFLRSHELQFTIKNDTYQEVVCHSERLGGNDEWCIELVK
ncbi:4739_t:CDS:2 [Funneliformis geosporum]|uniref:10821_t:CDS:1 n=1 Tax=Funneliformis geosporum TaxID=1117311 RepID=A0A9W4SCS1_9GLOM|nr:10821_t:CDS:2 [Funneliformis geosporum]CAI2179314.1 4739_t:CDS:2 [Funneliformis geosporum]